MPPPASGAAAAPVGRPGSRGTADGGREEASAPDDLRECARVFCQDLARRGSPKFFLPEAPEALCEPVTLAEVRAEAAARPAPRRAPTYERLTDAEAAAIVKDSLETQSSFGQAADAFVAARDEAFWRSVAASGLSVFAGLRFVVNVRLSADGTAANSFLVEGTAENLLLPVVETAAGHKCLTLAMARDVLPNAAELFQRLEEVSREVWIRERAEGGGMFARFEDAANSRVWCLRRVAGPRHAQPIRDPWWCAALPAARLEALAAQKNAANQRFVARDLDAALAGYDAVVLAVEGACAAPGAGPDAATQKLLATCLANRAACRIEVGGVRSLERAEDDCREALEGPWTAWLRQRFDDASCALHGKVSRRRHDARLRLDALLSDAAPRAVDGRRAPTVRSVTATRGGVALTAHCAGAGWASREVRDAPPVLLLVEFSRVSPFGPLNKHEMLLKAERGSENPDVAVSRTGDAIEVTLGAAAFRRLRAAADKLCLAAASNKVRDARAEAGVESPKGGRAPFCLVCDRSLAGQNAATHGLRRLACGGHFACGDCADAWYDALEACGRERCCPVCNDNMM